MSRSLPLRSMNSQKSAYGSERYKISTRQKTTTGPFRWLPKHRRPFQRWRFLKGKTLTGRRQRRECRIHQFLRARSSICAIRCIQIRSHSTTGPLWAVINQGGTSMQQSIETRRMRSPSASRFLGTIRSAWPNSSATGRRRSKMDGKCS